MDAVTYPDVNVREFLAKQTIPLQIQSSNTPLMKDFDVKWTPTLVVLDSSGKEHARSVGFLGPDEFIPWLMLGVGKTYFDTEKFKEAIAVLDETVTKYAGSDSAPEAIFIRGVAQYKNSGDPKPLRAAYDKLSAEYPKSEWTKRADPYKLIG